MYEYMYKFFITSYLIFNTKTPLPSKKYVNYFPQKVFKDYGRLLYNVDVVNGDITKLTTKSAIFDQV